MTLGSELDELQQQRPPSPFLTQLHTYYNQLAVRSAREARAVPSHVWTELALRDTAMHDWPNNLIREWRKHDTARARHPFVRA